MKIAGIIAEYNPFHLGHEYHIRETRRVSGCDCVVACMAGSFVQRGEPARLDKWSRAEMALRCGADAVFELPAAWAVRTADAFALGGVAILSGLGCDLLSFGSEIADMGLLNRLAALGEAEPPELSAAIQRGLAEGKSHARARGEAIAERLGIAPEALNAPNLALAVEYLRALRKLNSSMEPLAIRRRGDYHGDACRGAQGATPAPENCGEAKRDSAPASCARGAEGSAARLAGAASPPEDRYGARQEFASASAIRAMLDRGEMEAALACVPGVARELLAAAPGMHAPDDLLLYALRNMTEGELAALPDVGEGLEHRLARCAWEATSLAELIDMLKCKRYTRARLTRLCAHALLGVTQEFLAEHPLPEYARLLGMREDAKPLLRELSRRATLPIASDPVKLRDDPIFQLECRATDLRALCCDDPEKRHAGQEFARKFVRI